MDTQTSFFQVGAIALSIKSDIPEVLRDVEELYGDFHCHGPLPGALHFDILYKRRRPWSKLGYVVQMPGKNFHAGPDACAVMPELVAAVNYQVIYHQTAYLPFHAGSMVFEGQGVLLPAFSGFGKTTLVAALIARGWKYLSDEFALIDPDTLLVHPFPKALCIKESGFPLISSMGWPLIGGDGFALRSKWLRQYVKPWAVQPDVIGTPSPVKWLFFLSRHDGATRRLKKASAADSTMYLYALGLNREAFKQKGFAVAMELARRAEGFILRRGPVDLTCDLLETIIREGPDHPTLNQHFDEGLQKAAT